MRDSGTEALLFDLGGVVFGVDFESAFSYWAMHAGVPVETIVSRYCVDEWYEQHERGEIGAAEYFDALRDSLGITISDAQFAAGWNTIFEQESAGVFELFQSLGSRIPIYAFSNSNVTHQEFWERKYVKTLGLFREVFVSCDLGLRKPEAAAFRYVAAAIDTDPENILFFDDTRENVDAARDVGMSAIQVRSIADIRMNVTEFLE
ncbi:MAG: HAD family phosphatase [Gammaproteobacteria bacterium]|nr:MAG: HAD family phosphatase [Gammaproteobacteria bacterium]